MAQQTINNLETGKVVRDKINENFTENYSDIATNTSSIATNSSGIFSILNYANGEDIWDGVTIATTALTNTITAAAVEGGIVLIPTTENGSTYLIDANVTIPSNVTLWNIPGAILKGSVGTETLTINGGMNEDISQKFNNLVLAGLPLVSKISAEWFGMLISNSDNSTQFKQVVEFCNLTKINLEISSGDYTFATLITFTERLTNFKIIGNAGVSATKFNFTNSGYAINFSFGVLRFNIENIYFELGDTNTGIYIPNYNDDLSYHFWLYNCRFVGGIYALTMEHIAYVYLDKCTFTTQNSIDVARIVLGGTDVGTTYFLEYIYLTNCNIDGGQGVGYGDGILAYYYSYLIIDKCDIANWEGYVDVTRKNGIGIHVKPTTNNRAWNLFVSNTSMIRCYREVVLDGTDKQILHVNLDKIYNVIAQQTWVTDAHFLKTIGSSGLGTSFLKVSNLQVVTNASYSRTSDYDLEYTSYAEIEDIGNLYVISEGTDCFFCRYNPFRYKLKLNAEKDFDPSSLADGTDESTTITVADASLGDWAIASFSLDNEGIDITANVTSSNTVTVKFRNDTGGVVDLASGTLRAKVIKA